MSFIHYKLITNQNYEKIDFDGVSLSVGEIKKMVMEKKFRKHAPSAASSNTGNSSSRKSDVDLEVTNVDTNEVYKNDGELIPKNSRVQISRVVKNIGPAIAGGTITHTHKDSEKLADLRIKSTRLNEKQVRNDLDLDDSILLGSNGSKHSDTNSGQDSPDLDSHLYDDILSQNGVINDDFLDQKDPDTFNLNNRIDIKIPKQEVVVHKNEQDRPPGDFLCPFDDGQMKHLMDNAIIVPCCGYFICCEKCIRDKLNSNEPIDCPHESCSQEITINHRLTPYPPMRNKINEYLRSQSSLMGVPIEKLATKFATEQQCQSKTIKPSPNKVAAQNSSGQSPPNAHRPLIKLAVKLNSPKLNQEENKEIDTKPTETEIKTSRSESRSPVSSRSSSPSKVSSDSESVNSKISENGSISPVSQSLESRSNSPTPPSSPKQNTVEKIEQVDRTKNDESLQPIQSVFNQQYIPPQQFYPYNMPSGQMYPQMDPYFSSRFPRPNFPMQPQPMFNSNMMRFPPPSALHGQNLYQMYPGGHQNFMSEQFFPNRAHPSFTNGYQYQNFPRNSKVVRRRSRSRSRSRRSQERSRRKRSYSRSRSRSPRRYHRSSRHRSRSRSPSRRDKRASFKRRSSSRSKRDRSRSRSRDRSKKQTDQKTNRNDRTEDSRPKPLNKENEMDQREKTIHKLNNLMHRKNNVETKNYTNGASVTLTDNQIKESQLNEEKDAKKNQIVILLKTNSKQNEKSIEQNRQSNEDGTAASSPVKKSAVKRKVHLKKELAATSTVKKIMLEDSEEKKCSENEDRTEDFLDLSINEKINL